MERFYEIRNEEIHNVKRVQCSRGKTGKNADLVADHTGLSSHIGPWLPTVEFSGLRSRFGVNLSDFANLFPLYHPM